MANFKIFSPLSVFLMVSIASVAQGSSSSSSSSSSTPEVTMETGKPHLVLQRPGVAPHPAPISGELNEKNLQKRQSNFPDLLAPFRALFSGSSRGGAAHRRPIGPEHGFKSVASETNPKHNTAASPYSVNSGGSYGYRPSTQGGFSGSSDDDEPSGFRNAYFNGMPQSDGANNIGQYHFNDDNGGRQNFNQYYPSSSSSSSSNFMNQHFLKSQQQYNQQAPSQQYEQFNHNNNYNYRQNNNNY